MKRLFSWLLCFSKWFIYRKKPTETVHCNVLSTVDTYKMTALSKYRNFPSPQKVPSCPIEFNLHHLQPWPYQSDFGIDHLVMSMCRVISRVVGRGFCYDQCVLLVYTMYYLKHQGTYLVVKWLRLSLPNAGRLGSIPGQGTRSHTLQLKISHASTKMEDPLCCNWDPVQSKQINK